MQLHPEQLNVLCASESFPASAALRVGALTTFLASTRYDGLEWGKSPWVGAARLREKVLIGAIQQGEGDQAVHLRKVEKRQRKTGQGVPMIVDPTLLPPEGQYKNVVAPRFFRATALLRGMPDWQFDWNETDQLREAMEGTRLNGLSLDTFYDRYPRTDNRGPVWAWQDAWEVLLGEGLVGHVRITIGRAAIAKEVSAKKRGNAMEDWHVEKETWQVQLPSQNYQRTELYHMLRMVGEHWRPPYIGAKLRVTIDMRDMPSPFAPMSGARTSRAHAALVNNVRQALLE